MGKFLYHLCRLLVGGVFFFAGAVKGADIGAFAGEIANYRLLPYLGNYLVAAVLPMIEMLAGTLLLFNRRVRASALVAGGLNLVFIVALVSALVRGLDIGCGCFGPGDGGSSTVTEALVRDLALMAAIVLIFRLRGDDPLSR
ncbi:MAG: DoxX family membrane protein [Desulfuromonadaceae bacterium]|nr:DoxX family membrane protein [Desulfuromonadaceae bacterium]